MGLIQTTNLCLHPGKPKDFTGDESVVHFLHSFMTGGLPERFAANFINDLMNDYEEGKKQTLPGEPKPVVSWGTTDDSMRNATRHSATQNKNQMPNINSPFSVRHQKLLKNTSRNLNS